MNNVFLQVSTTFETKEDADRIALELVQKKLPAWVQVTGPIESTYRWQGQIGTACEWLCTIKTTQSCYPDLERTLTALHPYDNPEIIALPIAAGHEKYLTWLSESLQREA
jgi:periplasmic divalent cation tolerance protein